MSRSNNKYRYGCILIFFLILLLLLGVGRLWNDRKLTNLSIYEKQREEKPDIYVNVESTWQQRGFHIKYKARYELISEQDTSRCALKVVWRMPKDVFVLLPTKEFIVEPKPDIEVAADSPKANPFIVYSANDIKVDELVSLDIKVRYPESSDKEYKEIKIEAPYFLLKCEGQRLAEIIEAEIDPLVPEKYDVLSFKVNYLNGMEHLIKVPIVPLRSYYLYVNLIIQVLCTILITLFLTKM